jgi:glycerate kinase
VSGPPVLVAPDKFKGTFSAGEVAAAIAAGLRAGGREAVELPVADGGEGTAEALAPFLDEGAAAVDASAAIGLHLVPEAERDPLTASSAAAGELIAAAIEAGASHVIVGCGGTATMDGGVGMLEALDKPPKGVKFTAVCDVRTPWEQAAKLFGPQKGANPSQVKKLERRLDELAAKMKKDPRGVALTGCGGGISGALWSELGAALVPGSSFVLDALKFDEQMRQAAFVVTGEGRLDQSTLEGKAVAEVATRCRQAGVWCHAVVGQDRLDLFGKRVLDLASVHEAGDLAGLRRAGRALSR